MARYKHIDTSPRFIPVDLDRQLVPGTFAFALSYLIDHQLDFSSFDQRYRNDDRGATAYPPRTLLKLVLYAYSLGIVSSRAIEQACREHVTFIALSGDQAPHFTTIAKFVSGLPDEIAQLFVQVLWLCDQQGLIGRAMFAIDGVKLPSNASKAKSGTRADFARQAAKLETAAKTMLARHRAADELDVEPDLAAKGAEQQANLGAAGRATARVARGESRGPSRRQRPRHQEQPDRQRIGQDVHRQRRRPRLLRRRGGRRPAPDHRRGAGARHRFGAGAAAADDRRRLAVAH
jgi:transposase